MAFQYMENNPIYYPHHRPPHLQQHRPQPHLIDDDYHYFTLPQRRGPLQPHHPPPHLRPSASLHDHYFYRPPPAPAVGPSPRHLYQRPDHHRIYPDCYESLPKRKSNGNRRHKLARSSSTGNLYREYESGDDDRDYNWYCEEPEQHVPQYHEHRSSRRRRSRSNSNNNPTKLHSQQIDAETIIDLDSYTHIDGEPMNDLEVLAAKNAAINERKSRIIYTEEDEDETEEQPQQPKETIEVAVPSTAAASVDKMTETTTEAPSAETTVVDDENLSNMLQALTMTESNASTVVEPIVDESKEQLPQPAKKKRWPFAYLFKKSTTTPAERGKVEPAKSASTPPTPVLTPDTFTNSNISSTTTSATISPQHQISSHGFWAFRVPMTQMWYRFDNENQNKILEHVSHPNGILQVTDSHLGRGQIPIVVLPFQRICYYPTDATLHQLACLELSFVPSAIGGTLY
ncbi:hypothetical protein HMPREF1544_07154 [Mucor circinelloides 1006PhL]|uniref:Uncharacterized protein n=1 Tax=Mucor circinelloides f. circinelloides (strain 1006PhL) TaxID=1220926 RepID=S2JTJ1_MUCC1|nr:hypothetical protein HMPREF1544_07154 [Mucor circinelloides 1006PhL]